MIFPHLQSIQVYKEKVTNTGEENWLGVWMQMSFEMWFGAQVRINDIELRAYEDQELSIPECCFCPSYLTE